MIKKYSFIVTGVTFFLLSLSAHADNNPYSQYVNNTNPQNTTPFNPYSAGQAAPSSNQQMPDSSMQNTDNINAEMPQSQPAPAAAPAVPTQNTTTTSPVILYSKPTALVQPAGNVGQFNAAAPTANSTYSYVNPQSNINNSSANTAHLIPGLLPANSGTAGTTPSSPNQLIPILKAINQNVETGNQQIAMHYSQDQLPNLNFQPTTSDFVSVQSGFSALSNLYSSQSSFSTLWLSDAQKGEGKTEDSTEGPNSFDVSGYSSWASASQYGQSQGSQPWSPIVSYSMNSLNDLYYSAQGSSTPSPMAMLNTSVMTPFSSNAWMQQVEVATTPQLLRTIVLQNAVRNYMLYQMLRRQSEQEMLQATEVRLLYDMDTHVNKNIHNLDNDTNTSQQNLMNMMQKLMRSDQLGGK